MIENDALRPRSPGELLSFTMRIYGQNLGKAIGLSAVVVVPLAIITQLLQTQFLAQYSASGLDLSALNSGQLNAQSTAQLSALLNNVSGPLFMLILVSLVGALVRNVVVDGTLTYIASEALFGRRASLSEAFGALAGRRLPLALALALFFVIFAALAIAGALFFVFLCGLALGVLVYGYITAGLLITPVMVLERTGPVAGIRRSWRLGRTRLWPLLLLGVGVIVISFVASIVVSLIVGVIFPVTALDSGAAQVTLVVLQIISGLLLAPILPFGFTLIYYDARIRTESLVTALLAADKTDPRPLDVPSPSTAVPMTRDDVMNLALVTVGTFVLVLLYVGLSFTLAGGAR